jgi:Spy/CpxP family protein refolding chaperone
MKKLMTTIGIGLMIAIISPATAQEGKPTNAKKEHKDLTPEERAQKRTDKMTKELELSEEQAKQVYAINLNDAKEMEAIRIEKEKLKKRAKAQREKSKAEMDNVLTAEQKVKMEQLKKAKIE